MNPIFKKLQFKDQASVLVRNAPAEFESQLAELPEATRVYTRASGKQRFPFVLVFVRTCAELERAVALTVARLEPDARLWFAYPKKASKRYDSDIGRDDSWQSLGDLGFEGVRMITIDEDWSALRLRHLDHIKSMQRDPKRAMSAKSKRRAGH